MSPIEGISDVRILPRLGKIRLGIKVEQPQKNPYPKATDYFVVPEEIRGTLGETPRQLRIMFPVEDPDIFAAQFLKCYSFTQGLICRGDGIKAKRKVDIVTRNIANHETEQWEMVEFPCNPEKCPQAVGDPERKIKPQCRRVMNLLFILPEVPGLGVWQLDTSSFYSIVNINSCVDVIRGLCGRIHGIPLTLSLEPREVTPPGIKKKTVHVLHLRSNLRLAELQRLATKRLPQAIMPTAEEEEPPEDLFPPEVLGEAEDYPNEPVVTEVGNAVIIDPVWLMDSQRTLKWTDETMKSFIVFKFKIDSQGTLTNVLKRLSHNQAGDFIDEINRKIESINFVS